MATASPRAPERFRSIVFGCSGLFESSDPDGHGFVRVDNSGILRACDEYGVIRADVLRQIPPLGSYPHSDRIINIELALYGPFHQTPDWLYFRRDHPDRAYNASPTVRALCANLNPLRANRLRHPTVRLLAEYAWGYVAAIRRAPLSPADRRECLRSLAQWMIDRATNKILSRRLEPFGDQLHADSGGRDVSVDAVAAGQGRKLP